MRRRLIPHEIEDGTLNVHLRAERSFLIDRGKPLINAAAIKVSPKLCFVAVIVRVITREPARLFPEIGVEASIGQFESLLCLRTASRRFDGMCVSLRRRAGECFIRRREER